MSIQMWEARKTAVGYEKSQAPKLMEKQITGISLWGGESFTWAQFCEFRRQNSHQIIKIH